MNEQKNTAPANDARTLGDKLAEGPSDGLGRTAFWEKQMREGKKCITLPPGVERFVNVQPQLISAELKSGGLTQFAGYSIRLTNGWEQRHPVWAREIEIMGTTQCELNPGAPLPCTEGRGIAHLRTSAAIRCYVEQGVDSLPPESDKVLQTFALDNIT